MSSERFAHNMGLAFMLQEVIDQTTEDERTDLIGLLAETLDEEHLTKASLAIVEEMEERRQPPAPPA